MLLNIFKRILRMAENNAVYPAGRHSSLRVNGARPESERPTAEFLARTLRSALAQNQAETRGGRAMQQSLDDPTSKPGGHDTEQPDSKVVRFTPRRRTEPERRSEPPMSDDDDDPGPSAA
jgi:hypothetical protein